MTVTKRQIYAACMQVYVPHPKDIISGPENTITLTQDVKDALSGHSEFSKFNVSNKASQVSPEIGGICLTLASFLEQIDPLVKDNDPKLGKALKLMTLDALSNAMDSFSDEPSRDAAISELFEQCVSRAWDKGPGYSEYLEGVYTTLIMLTNTLKAVYGDFLDDQGSLSEPPILEEQAVPQVKKTTKTKTTKKSAKLKPEGQPKTDQLAILELFQTLTAEDANFLVEKTEEGSYLLSVFPPMLGMNETSAAYSPEVFSRMYQVLSDVIHVPSITITNNTLVLSVEIKP